MTPRPPRQQAALDKFNHALSTAIGDRCIERMSDAERDDVLALAIGALTTRDVAAFWPLPHPSPACGGGSGAERRGRGQGGCAGDFVDLPPDEAAPTCARFAQVRRPQASVTILPVVRIERPGVDLAHQPCPAGLPGLIPLRRRG